MKRLLTGHTPTPSINSQSVKKMTSIEADCEFLLVIGKFSLLDVNDGFYSKNTARDCMVDPEVQAAVNEKWTQWMAETKGAESYNDESQYTGTCQLSQLLEEIGQPDTQNHSQTEGSFHPSSPDDKMGRPEAGSSNPLSSRGPTDTVSARCHPSEAVSARSHLSKAVVSALAKIKQPTLVEDLIISPEEQAILEALEEWKEDYHPPPSQDTTSSSSTSRPSFSQPTLAESPRKRDHTGACKKSCKTDDKNKLPRSGTSKITIAPVDEASQSTARQNVSSDENRITDSQIQAKEASFSQRDQGNVDPDCQQYSNTRADGQGTSTSKEDILKPKSSTNAGPGYFSIKGISRHLINSESQQDKTPAGQGMSRTKEPLVQETNTEVRSPHGFTDEYLKFLDSSSRSKKNLTNTSKVADKRDSSDKSEMADKSDSSVKSMMAGKSDSSNKSMFADKSDSSVKSKMADNSDSSDKSTMADENNICVIDVVTLGSLPTAWHKPSEDSLEFSCSLPEDFQNSQDSQISMISKGMSQSSQTDAELGAGDAGKLSVSPRMDLVSEECQSEVQARQTDLVGRGRSTQPDTRRVSFAPTAVMKCPSVDLDKVGSTQPFDVVNDSTYSMYEDAKSHLSIHDNEHPSSSHLDFPESQPFVPSSQDFLSSDSVEEKSKSSSSDPSSRVDCTDDCDSVEHLTEAHSTQYSDSVVNDTSFHHSTQTSGVMRKSTPDFLISPIRGVTRNSRADFGDESGSDNVNGIALSVPESQQTSAVIECMVQDGESQKRSAVDKCSAVRIQSLVKISSKSSGVREKPVDKAASQCLAVRELSVDKAASQRSAIQEQSVDKAASLPKSPAHDHPSFDESDSLERIPLSHGLCKGGKTGAAETVQELSTPETDARASTTMVVTRSKRKKNFLQSSQKASDCETFLSTNRRKPVTNSNSNMTQKSVQSPTLDKQDQSAKETDKDQSDIKSDSEIIIEEYSTDCDVSKQNEQHQSQKDSFKSGDKSASGGQIVRADVHVNMDVDSCQKAGPSCTKGNDSEDDCVILVSDQDEDEELIAEIAEAEEPKSGKELSVSRSGNRGLQKSVQRPQCPEIMDINITTRRTRSSKQGDDGSLEPLKLRNSRLVGPGPKGDVSSQNKNSPKCTQNNMETGTATHGHKKSFTDNGKKGKKRSKFQLRKIPEAHGEEEEQGPHSSHILNKVTLEEDAERNPSKKKKRREVEIMFEKAVKKYGLIGNVSKGWQGERCYGKPQKCLSRANKKDEESWSQVLKEAGDKTGAHEELGDGANTTYQSLLRECHSDEEHEDMHPDGGVGPSKVQRSQARGTHSDQGLKDMHTVYGTSQDHVEDHVSKLKKRAPADNDRRQMKGPLGGSTWDAGRTACRRVSNIRQASGIDCSEDVPKTQVLLDFLEMQPHRDHQPFVDVPLSPDVLHKICNVYRKPISYRH